MLTTRSKRLEMSLFAKSSVLFLTVLYVAGSLSLQINIFENEDSDFLGFSGDSDSVESGENNWDYLSAGISEDETHNIK
ncbi:unnamed protein product [Tenebrio molitor]|nr:unnamed protein product [Tenebrio molitor]